VSEYKLRLIREVIETITVTLLILFIIRLAVQSFRTDGQSMEPNFHTGEYVLVNKVAYFFQEPHRGDVIVFHYPFDIHKDFMKRVIGMPGDTIQTTETQVLVNGEILHEPYVSLPLNFESRTWRLGPSQFFVMGDNRDNSLDSRIWGPLEQKYIVGKVMVVYWPVTTWSVVDTYPSVYATLGSP
jgi:signal peptidase I